MAVSSHPWRKPAHLDEDLFEFQPTIHLVSVQDLLKLHPALGSEAAIRALIKRRLTNGLAPHIFWIGRRVAIDAFGFEEWLRESQPAEARAAGAVA